MNKEIEKAHYPEWISLKTDKNGLIPAIIQDADTRSVLMMGYMNEAAYQTTIDLGKVTFFSRSRDKQWTKGEESGNFLFLEELRVDCDKDTLLIKASPAGPVCHTGSDTCWNELNFQHFGFFSELEAIIESRQEDIGNDNSYVSSLFKKGINKIAQKVGEEAVEVIIEAKDNNEHLFLNEAADLIFHYMILLKAKGYSLKDIESILRERHKKDA